MGMGYIYPIVAYITVDFILRKQDLKWFFSAGQVEATLPVLYIRCHFVPIYNSMSKFFRPASHSAKKVQESTSSLNYPFLFACSRSSTFFSCSNALAIHCQYSWLVY